MSEVSCYPSCWEPIPCPACGRDMPPRGHSIPLEMAGSLGLCCFRNGADPDKNPRHYWDRNEYREYLALQERYGRGR